MMTFKIGFPILLLSIIASSCLLQSVEKNFRQVDPTPNSANQSAISYSYDGVVFYPMTDTIWLSDQVQFKFTGGNVYQYKILIGTQLVSVDGIAKGTYLVQKGQLQNGVYDLQFIQSIVTGTGSLADKLGTESSDITTNRVVVVESGQTFTPTINKVAIQNGAVTLSWNQYSHTDFQSYKIIVTGADVYNPASREIIVTNQTQTSIIDSAYISGKVNYQLVVNGTGSLASALYPFNYTYSPRAELAYVSPNQYKLSWLTPLTYNAVKYYNITLSAGYGLSPSIIVSNPKTTQTSIDVYNSQLEFGYPYNYIFGINGKSYTSDGTSAIVTLPVGEVQIGNRLPFFNFVLHDTQAATFFLYAADYYTDYWGTHKSILYLLDDKTFNIIDSVSSPSPFASSLFYGAKIVASANGKYYYKINDYQIQQFDPHTLATIQTVLPSTLGACCFGYSPDNSTVTDNNFIQIGGYVFDMNANKQIFNFSGLGHLSSDGNYFINRADLYSYNSSTYVKTSTLPYTNIVYEQFLNNTSQVVLIANSSVVIYDCLNGVELHSYPISTTNPLARIDQISKSLIFSGTAGMQIIDLTTGIIRNGTINSSTGTFFYQAGDLFVGGVSPYFNGSVFVNY
jgi:hypothetical protein